MSNLIQDKDVSRQFYYEWTVERLAILDLIAHCEGTDRTLEGKSGYDIIYGFRRFNDFSKHPRIRVTAGGWTSSAAGRYQILDKTWDWIQNRLKQTGFKPFPSFSPEYQDQAAMFLIDAKRQAMQLVDSRNLDRFMDICSWEWASIPPARYGQPVLTPQQCRVLYNRYLTKWRKVAGE